MTQRLVWYTVRASGIVTWALVTASVLWGLLLSSRSTRKPRPAWVLDLHRFLAGLSFAFLAVHLGGLLLDTYVGFSPAALFVPFASRWRPAAVAWGIAALYLLVAIELTSLLMNRLSRRLWHAIHLGSFVVFATATVHGLTAGTDAHHALARDLAVAAIAAVVALTLLRVVSRAVRRARRGRGPRRGVLVSASRPVERRAPLEPPTLRPLEDAIAEVRRGAARGGGVARRAHVGERVSRRAHQ